VNHSTVVLAHGVGSRTDLPIPTWLVLAGSGTAVLVSFLAVTVLWRTARLHRLSGRALPRACTRLLDFPAARRIAQAITLALSLLVVVVALTGPVDVSANIAPWALYVTFWVGLVPASLLLGPVWRVLNPLRLAHRLLSEVAGPGIGAGRLDRLGYWPASLSLLIFVWIELVVPDRANPTLVGLFLVSYAVAQLIAALWFGEGWFARGDGFEVYSTLLGRLAPIGRDGDGRLQLRNPLRGAAAVESAPGLPAVVIVLVASTAFDGLSRTRIWQDGAGAANDLASGTIGLVAMICLTGALFLIGVRLTALTSRIPVGATVLFAPSLLPIAAGYAIAHYFSLLIFDGQMTWILASNPFAVDGRDLFGTYGAAVNYTLVTPATIGYVQVGAIVLGHVLGVVLAHDRGLRVAPAATSANAQLPLVTAMIVYTVGGLALLFGT